MRTRCGWQPQCLEGSGGQGRELEEWGAILLSRLFFLCHLFPQQTVVQHVPRLELGRPSLPMSGSQPAGVADGKCGLWLTGTRWWRLWGEVDVVQVVGRASWKRLRLGRGLQMSREEHTCQQVGPAPAKALWWPGAKQESPKATWVDLGGEASSLVFMLRTGESRGPSGRLGRRWHLPRSARRPGRAQLPWLSKHHPPTMPGAALHDCSHRTSTSDSPRVSELSPLAR